MKEASWQEKLENEKVRCLLCPHFCLLSPGQRGNCKVRKNIDGVLYSEVYGRLSAVNFDPVEKKPLYHYYPSQAVLSIGSIGCNLHCRFCQNAEISQNSIDMFPMLEDYRPDEIVDMALKRNTFGIAYTYNEPTVWFEFFKDTAQLAKKNGLKNISVTNLFINQDPLKELSSLVDAFSVDIKAFTEEFYKSLCSASLHIVLENLRFLKRQGKYIELVNLIIPGKNDDKEGFRKMVSWIRNELGEDTVLHLSAYHPAYQLDIMPTPPATLSALYDIAIEYLNFVYVGNLHLHKGRHTYCKNCGELLIRRDGYYVSLQGLNEDGCCSKCGEPCVVCS